MAVRRLRPVRSRFWGDSVGRNPTDRGKAGSKRSLLVDGNGGPLSVVAAGANVHDTKLLSMTWEGVVVARPDSGDAGAICAWTSDITIQRAGRPWRPTAAGGTYGG